MHLSAAGIHGLLLGEGGMFERINPRGIAHAFFAITGCVSSGAVWAVVAPETLGTLPWPQIFIGIALSLWGGLTRTAERALEASKLARDDKETVFYLWHELPRDLIVASGVGFLVFAIGSWQMWGVWLLGSALWLSGYLGTRLLAGLGEAALTYLQRRSGGRSSTND